MAERNYLSPAAIKALAAKTNAKKTKKAESKKETAKKVREKVATAKVEAERTSFKENVSNFSNSLEGNKVTSESELLVPQEQAPNKISENTSYHNALASIIGDFDNRVSQLTYDSDKARKEEQELRAKELGVTVNELPRTSTTAKSVSNATIDSMTPARTIMSQAKKSLTQSWLAHHAGDHISAAEHFTNASDSVAAALRHVNSTEALGKPSSEYNEVFKDSRYGDKKSPFIINYDSMAKLTAATNGYVNHALTMGVGARKVHPEAASEVKNILNREYDTELQPSYITKALGRYVPLTPEAKEAIAQRKTERAAAQKDSRNRSKAITTGATFAVPDSGDWQGPSEAQDTGITRYDSITAPRELIKPHFEADEARNADSAANAKKSYVKKSWVGSLAHQNPEQWHVLNQVKTHWLANNKGARPEDFESSAPALDPHGYIESTKTTKSPIKLSPFSELPSLKTKKPQVKTEVLAARTDYKLDLKSPVTQRIFAEDLATLKDKGRGISPTQGTLKAFYPKATDFADKSDTISPEREAVQLKNARKTGATLDTAEQQEAITPATPATANRRRMTSGAPVAADTELTPAVESAVAAKRGLKVHFEDGSGAGK